MCINPLLDILEINNLGYKIATTHVGSSTCADDILLLSKDPWERQVMLHLHGRFITKERYNLSATKSQIMIINPLKNRVRQAELVINGQPIQVVLIQASGHHQIVYQ